MDQQILILALGAASSTLKGLFDRQFDLARIQAFRRYVQIAQADRSIDANAFRFLLALDYVLESGQSQLLDTSALKRAMEALIAFDRRLAEDLMLDYRMFEAFPAEPVNRLLAQPILAFGPTPQLSVISERLLGLRGKWEVWEGWLRNCWLGAVPNRDLRFFVDWDVSLWRAPAQVNEWIAVQLRHRNDEDLQPENVGDQEHTSISFTITGSGEIDVDPHTAAGDLVQNQLAIDLHEELLALINELARECTSSNLLVPLGRSLERFRSSIGKSPSELSPGYAIPRGNALRGELEIDERRRVASDPDMPPFPEGIAGALKQVTQVWNIYVANDPSLDLMDLNRLGPDSALARARIDGATEAVSSARQQQLATVAAADVLDEVIVYASGDTRAAERARFFQEGAFRNFARQAMRAALYIWRNGKAVAGLTIAAGGVVAAGLRALAWVHENVGFLERLLAQYPNLLTLLRRLIEVTGGG